MFEISFRTVAGNYRLLRHVTRFPHTNVQYSDVERLSVGDPAHSTSLYSLIDRPVVFLKTSPLLGDPLNISHSISSIHMFLGWVVY